METKITAVHQVNIAEIQSENIEIYNAQDAIDILGNCVYQGISKIILHEKNIVPELFNLKTGIAGEVFQKCSNYRVQLAIVGDFSKFASKSLHDFIYESNKHRQINFVSSTEEAIEKLVKY